MRSEVDVVEKVKLVRKWTRTGTDIAALWSRWAKGLVAWLLTTGYSTNDQGLE